MPFTLGRSSNSCSSDPSSPAIALIGGDLRLLAVTPAFAALLGHTPEQLAGRSIADLYDAADRVADGQLIRRVLSRELPHFDRVKRWTHRSGGVVRGQLAITPAQGQAGEIYCALAKLTLVSDSVCAPSSTPVPIADESDDQIERIRKAMMW